MADDTPPPDDPERRRPWDKPAPRSDRDQRDERDRYEEEDEEDEERPRRRRRHRPPEPEYDPALKMVVPLNTSALAIIAGYLGLISVLCFPAPFALLFGILALRHLKKHPDQDGKGRAIFGIVMGALFSIPLPIMLVAMIAGK